MSVSFASMASADVTGKVTLTGKAPVMKEIDMSGVKECAAQHVDPMTEQTVVASDKGELANVVISVKTDDPDSLGGEASKTPAVLDQKGCMYEPHVLPMMVGQKLVIKNDDAFLHNVHSLPTVNPGFNFGQPNKDGGKDAPAQPKVAENIKVKCDVHPWMSAWIVVLNNPFFSTSKEDGSFAIKGLPDGEYTLVAWHEVYGTAEQKVKVAGGNASVNFTFKSATAEAPIESNIKLASTSTTEMECEACVAAEKAMAEAAKAPAAVQTVMAR
jgi:hypothetical protein